ncbi:MULTISPECIES: acyl carrier protein [Chitinophaga]|uniref:acyl carrier protein n=1 Tax=Chitinophaga TaxID=79328 RepID=UPI001157D8DC|nr:acyl carrier protein [Chitinophaga polysaccharea]
MSISQQFNEAVSKALSVPADMVTDELEYQSIPEWDSMTHLVLVAGLETTFGIAIDMDDVLEMGSIGKIKTLLKKYNVEVV